MFKFFQLYFEFKVNLQVYFNVNTHLFIHLFNVQYKPIQYSTNDLLLVCIRIEWVINNKIEHIVGIGEMGDWGKRSKENDKI